MAKHYMKPIYDDTNIVIAPKYHVELKWDDPAGHPVPYTKIKRVIHGILSASRYVITIH